MLIKKQGNVRHPSRRVLEALSGAFREIEAHFELLGFTPEEPESISVEAPEEPGEEEDLEEPDEEYEVEYVDEDESGGGVYQREEIEVAIDIFISELIDEKVIKQPKNEKAPSLVSVFERIFGEDHEIVKLIHEFDDNIEGYFGAISYDDMKSACGNVFAIRGIINKELAKYEGK